MRQMVTGADDKQKALGFLPAVLEIQETPPSPLGRAILWSIFGFFVLAVAWASIGQVDIVAVAQGRIIPNGHSKVIQPLDIGIIKKIHVQEGQQVQAGDVLIELDSAVTLADWDRLSAEKMLLESEIARVRRLLSRLHSEEPEHKQRLLSQNAETDIQPSLQSAIFHSQWAEFQARLEVLHRQLTKRRAERGSLRRQIEKIEATLPLITERVNDLHTLLQKQVVAEHHFLQVEEQRVTQQHELKFHNSRIKEMDAAIGETKSSIALFRKEFEKTQLQEVAEKEKQLFGVRQALIKAKTRKDAQVLTAPIDGAVQQLTVHTIGGVVTPAQTLMHLIPQTGRLEVEAVLENKDIGFVEEGQKAAVKIEAFPFTKYGTVAGEVLDLSNDAVADEKRGLVYKARVVIHATAITIGDRFVNLVPGMAVVVEIKTGKRRLMEYIMSPLLRYKDESARER